MNKILLTGFTGFTGKYILQEAANLCFDIACLSEDGTPQSNSVNLMDYASVKEKVREIRPSSLIHLAAVSHVQHVPASDFYSINIGGTRNLLQALEELPHPNYINNVFASSANVYGNSRMIELSEDTPLNPVNDYGLSKKCMEELLSLWKGKIPITITRPFNYTGVGQSENFLIPKIVAAFRKRKASLELGNLEVSRDFSDVRFIAKAYLTLATQTSRFESINLCSGKLTSISKLIEILSALTQHDLQINTNPLFQRKDEILELKGNPHRMAQILGYTSPYSLEETLSWMLST